MASSSAAAIDPSKTTKSKLARREGPSGAPRLRLAQAPGSRPGGSVAPGTVGVTAGGVGATAGGELSSITVIEKDWLASANRPFEAVTVKSNVPALVGVPDSTPVRAQRQVVRQAPRRDREAPRRNAARRAECVAVGQTDERRRRRRRPRRRRRGPELAVAVEAPAGERAVGPQRAGVEPPALTAVKRPAGGVASP